MYVRRKSVNESSMIRWRENIPGDALIAWYLMYNDGQHVGNG